MKSHLWMEPFLIKPTQLSVSRHLGFSALMFLWILTQYQGFELKKNCMKLIKLTPNLDLL